MMTWLGYDDDQWTAERKMMLILWKTHVGQDMTEVKIGVDVLKTRAVVYDSDKDNKLKAWMWKGWWLVQTSEELAWVDIDDWLDKLKLDRKVTWHG